MLAVIIGPWPNIETTNANAAPLKQLDHFEGAHYFAEAMIVPISRIQVRRDEDGVWVAKSKLLPGCHAHGADRGEAILRFQEAAKAHLEALMETGRPIPPAFREKFILAA